MTAAGAITAASILLGLAVAAGPSYVSSAGTALLAAELVDLGGGQLTLLGVHASAMEDPDTIRRIDRHLRTELHDRQLPSPTVQVVLDGVTALAEPETMVALIGREGASHHLPEIVADAAGPFAIPSMSAARLGELGAGDDLRIRRSDGTVATLQVGPVVQDLDRDDVPPFWQPVSGMLTAVDDPRIPPPGPALLAEPDAVLDVLDEVGGRREEGGLTHGLWARASWTVPFEGDLTLEQAQAILPHVTSVRTDVVDPTTELGGLLATGGVPGSVSGQQVDAALQRVERATAALVVPVRALGWAAQLLAVVGLSVATVLGARRPLSRARLWAARGVAAPALGLRWGAFSVIPVAVGLVAGWALAWAGTEALGPGGAVDRSIIVGLWIPLAAAGIVAVLTVGVVVTWVSASAARETTRGGVPPVAEAVAVVLAGLALWRLDTNGGAVTLDPEGTLRLDVLTLAAPLLVVVAVAVVGTRLLGVLCRHGFGRGDGRGAGYLTTRRLGSIGGATLGLVAVVATSIGLLVVATTLSVSADATVEEQVGLLLGADAVVPLSRAEGVSGGLDAAAIGLPATRVRRAPESLLDERVTIDVLAVDPATFAEVAFRPRQLGEVDVAELAARLAGTAGDGLQPAIVVGASFAGDHDVSVGGVDFPIEQVASVPVFPGASGERPTVVVADAGALAPEDRAVAARLAIAVYPELWVDGGDLDAGELQAHLAQVTLPSSGSGPGATGPREFEYAAERRADPGLAPARWTFSFLRAQALLLAVVTVGGLLLHHRGRERDRALSTALARRMGLGRREVTTASALELSLLLLTGTVLGVVAGLVGARIMLQGYAPLPEVALPVAFVAPVRQLGSAVLVGVVLVGVTVLAGRRSSTQADVATLLRGGA